MNILAALPALACALPAWPLARRQPGFRTAAGLLVGLGGLALLWVAVESSGPLQAATTRPYAGWHRWAWAVDSAGVLAGAALRVAVAWVGLAGVPTVGDTRSARTGNGKVVPSGVCVASNASPPAALGIRQNDVGVAFIRRFVPARARQPLVVFPVTAFAVTLVKAFSDSFDDVGGRIWSHRALIAFAATASILHLAYPQVRGPDGPWLTLCRYYLPACAAAQLLALGQWASRKSAERAYSAGSAWATAWAWWAAVSTRERVGLLFAAGGGWDVCGDLAPWAADWRAWGITRAGNALFLGAVCAVEMWALWR